MVSEKHTAEIINIVARLRAMEVDGETMQMILEMMGMEDQMLRQLIMTAQQGHLENLLEEREELGNTCQHSWVDMDNEAPYGQTEQCRFCGDGRVV